MKEKLARVKKGFNKFTDRIKSLKIKRTEKANQNQITGVRANTFDRARTIKYIIIALIIVFFVAEFGFGVAIYGFKSQSNLSKIAARIIPFPAAFTTSGVVTVSEYWKEKEYILHFYDSTKQANVDSNQLSQQILQQEAENKIIGKQAIAFKTTVSAKEVNDSMDQIYQSNGGQTEVEKALKDLYGLSVNDFKQLVKVQLTRDKISKEVIKHVTARHILIRVDQNATQAQVDEAKARIDKYAAEIKAGLDFAAAANKYSEDVGSNQNGGLLDPFARGDMVKEFEDVAFSTKPGQISLPFRSSFGWHILKVESTSGHIDMSFDNWLSGMLKNSLAVYLYKDK